MAILCLVTLVAGFVSLRNRPGETSTAIRVDAAAGPVLGSPGPRAPGAPGDDASAAGAISLRDLVQEVRTAATTSTVRPRTTVTTRKPATTTTSSPPSTTTTRPPATTGPAPTQAATPPRTTPLTPLTTLLQNVVPPAVAVAGTLTRTDSGVASWFNAPDATCAHRTLAMGTSVKVTRNHNGASATCTVNDRGPTLGTGRLIDLSLDTFEKLAAPEAGLIDVSIEW